MLGILIGAAAAAGTKIPLKFPGGDSHHDISISAAHTIMLFPTAERSQNITFSVSTDTDRKVYSIKNIMGINFGTTKDAIITFRSKSNALLHVHIIEPQTVPDEYLLSTYASDNFVIATNKTTKKVCSEVTYPLDIKSYGLFHMSGAPTTVTAFETNIDDSCTMRYQLGEADPRKSQCFGSTNLKTDGEAIFTVKFTKAIAGAFAMKFATPDHGGIFGSYRRYFSKTTGFTLLTRKDPENKPREEVSGDVCRAITENDYPQQTPSESPSPSPSISATASRSPVPTHSPSATRTFLTRSRSPKPLVMHQGDTYTVSFTNTGAIIVSVLVIVVCFCVGLVIAQRIWPRLVTKLRATPPKKQILKSQEQPLMQKPEQSVVQKEDPNNEQPLSDGYAVPGLA